MQTKKPLLIFRIGYMSSYDGVGEISGGGSHIKEHGEGGEMWNVYGHVKGDHLKGLWP
jgi:hypothetical protein